MAIIIPQAGIATLWTANGGWARAAGVASAIAMAESGGRLTATVITLAKTVYVVGLWQVNFAGKLETERVPKYGTPTHFALTRNDQARAAIDISTNGTNWTAWTTYKSGAYLKYLPTGTAPPSRTTPAPLPPTTAWRAYAYEVINGLTTWILTDAIETQEVMQEAINIFQSI